jgi:hypothetical protein
MAQEKQLHLQTNSIHAEQLHLEFQVSFVVFRLDPNDR